MEASQSSTMPDELRYSERALWERGDEETRAVLARLARFREKSIEDLHRNQELEAELSALKAKYAPKRSNELPDHYRLAELAIGKLCAVSGCESACVRGISVCPTHEHGWDMLGPVERLRVGWDGYLAESGRKEPSDG